jgi:formylglycine-generating enzyme required for sulfatase activity
MGSASATVAAIKGCRPAGAGRIAPMLVLLLIAASAACGSSDRGDSAPPASVVATPEPTAGQIRTDSRGIEQVWVPAGSFLMGTDEATVARITDLGAPGYITASLATEGQHRVALTRGYWIDRYEVANADFKAFIAAGGYDDQTYWSADGFAWLAEQADRAYADTCVGDLPNEPVRCVTWYEAEAYARWRGGRLPTEAEWEYAARGPKSLEYPWGNDFDAAKCNVVDSTSPAPVGSFAADVSWIGAHDMAGNAMEWVQDWMSDDYYANSPASDPPGPDEGTQKIEKGGWWGGNQFAARSASRHFEDGPDYRDDHIGFRIVTP